MPPSTQRDILSWKKRDVSKPPPLLKYRSAKWFILATICIAVFTDLFLYGIIIPVIPFALTTRAGVAENDVQHWVSILLAVYGAALLAASPICGWLADHSSSRRLPLLLGLLSLAGSTILLCLGRSVPIFILGRLLQGISAAVVWTVGLALLVDTVDENEIGQFMGYVSLSMSCAVLVAPLLGGVVYARGGYYAVYYMAFALIVLDIVLRVALVEKKVAMKWVVAEEDEPISLDTSPKPPTSLPTEQEKDGNSTIPTNPKPSPTLPLPTTTTAPPHPSSKLPPVFTLLASPRLLSALYCSLSQSTLLTAFDAVLPLRVSSLFQYTSLGAGLIFLPLILPSFLALLIGAYADNRGPRLPTLLGFLLAVPFLVLLRYVSHPGTSQVVLLCALLALVGLALTMVMTPLLAEITYVIQAQERSQPGKFGPRGAYAQAYGLFNCAFAAGILIGPIWGGFVSTKVGWGTMCWTLGVLSAVGAIPAGLLTGGWVGKRKETMEKAAEIRADEVDEGNGV